MRKIITTLTMCLCALSFAQITPMITKFETSGPDDKKIAINTTGGGEYTYKKVGNPDITGTGLLKDGLKTEIYLPESGAYIVEIMPLSDTAPSVLLMGKTTYEEAAELKEISQWGNFSKGKSASSMLTNCVNVVITAIDIPDFSQTTDMFSMFYRCESITTIPNINKWDVSKVYDMDNMFNGAYQFNSDISGWNTKSVGKMSRMFSQRVETPGQFNQDISGWDVSNVRKMTEMFSDCQAFNQDLSKWNTENVRDFSGMFSGATAFDQNLGNFKLNNATNIENMFDNVGMSCVNYSNTLNGWLANAETAEGLVLSAEGLSYGNKENRDKLISQKKWTIQGDNYDKDCAVALSTEDVTLSEISVNNPVQNFLNVKSSEGIKKIEIYSLAGTLVKVFKQKQNTISDLASGVYIVKVYQSSNRIGTFKIVKK